MTRENASSRCSTIASGCRAIRSRTPYLASRQNVHLLRIRSSLNPHREGVLHAISARRIYVDPRPGNAGWVGAFGFWGEYHCMEKQMRKLTLILAAAGCVGLAAPVVATERPVAKQNGPQVVSSELSGKSAISEFSAKKQKAKKKSATSRSSWGG